MSGSAFVRRRVRVGELDEHMARAVIRRLADDRAGGELVDVESTVLARAEWLAHDVAVTTLDAIHIASALVVVEGMVMKGPFVTADARRRIAAERAHLQVVWVE
jgi:predicted nucleic acid-binding protein